MTALSLDMSMGLAVWASMPAARAVCTSSSKALAVMAMMGITSARGCPLPRMARVAS